MFTCLTRHCGYPCSAAASSTLVELACTHRLLANELYAKALDCKGPDRAYFQCCIDSQLVVEMCQEHSPWSGSIHFRPFRSHFDSSCRNRTKQKGRYHSFVREFWQLPNRPLYKLEFVSGPSGVLISG